MSFMTLSLLNLICNGGPKIVPCGLKSSISISIFSGAYIIDSEQVIKTSKKRYMYWDVSLLILSAAYYNYLNKKGFNDFLEGFHVKCLS